MNAGKIATPRTLKWWQFDTDGNQQNIVNNIEHSFLSLLLLKQLVLFRIVTIQYGISYPTTSRLFRCRLSEFAGFWMATEIHSRFLKITPIPNEVCSTKSEIRYPRDQGYSEFRIKSRFWSEKRISTCNYNWTWKKFRLQSQGERFPWRSYWGKIKENKIVRLQHKLLLVYLFFMNIIQG